MISLLLLINIFFSIVLFLIIKKEQKRNKILQAFIAGIVRSISDYTSTTDRTDLEKMPKQNMDIPISYSKVLDAVEYELLKNVPLFPVETYEKRLNESRQIFLEKENEDGFVFMNFDLFDRLVAHWKSNKKD